MGNIPLLRYPHGVIPGAAGAGRGLVKGPGPGGRGQGGNLVPSASDLGAWLDVRSSTNSVEASEACLGVNITMCGVRNGGQG